MLSSFKTLSENSPPFLRVKITSCLGKKYILHQLHDADYQISTRQYNYAKNIDLQQFRPNLGGRPRINEEEILSVEKFLLDNSTESNKVLKRSFYLLFNILIFISQRKI
jgi:hypothetical protein